MRTTSIVAHMMRTFCVIVRNGGAFENLGKTGGWAHHFSGQIHDLTHDFQNVPLGSCKC